MIVAVDSKYLHKSLSTQFNSIDKSIRADSNCIRHELEVVNVDDMDWLPGKVNLADTGTKYYSPLYDASQILMQSEKIQIDLSRHELRC